MSSMVEEVAVVEGAGDHRHGVERREAGQQAVRSRGTGDDEEGGHHLGCLEVRVGWLRCTL